MKGNKFLISFIASMLVILLLASFVGYKEDERRKSIPETPTEEQTDEPETFVEPDPNLDYAIEVVNSKDMEINGNKHTFKLHAGALLSEDSKKYDVKVTMKLDDTIIAQDNLVYENVNEEVASNIEKDANNDLEITTMLGLDQKEYIVYKINNSAVENNTGIYKIFNEDKELLAKITTDTSSGLTLTYGNNINAYFDENSGSYKYYAFEKNRIRYLKTTITSNDACKKAAESDFKEYFITIRDNNIITSDSTTYHGINFEGSTFCGHDIFSINIVKRKDNSSNENKEIQEGKTKLYSETINVGNYEFGVDVYKNVVKKDNKYYTTVYYDLSNYNFIILKNITLFTDLEYFNDDFNIKKLDFLKVVKGDDDENYLIVEDYDSTSPTKVGLTIYGLDTKKKAGRIIMNYFNSYPDELSDYINDNKRYDIKEDKIVYVKSNEDNHYYNVTVSIENDTLSYDYEQLGEVNNDVNANTFKVIEE